MGKATTMWVVAIGVAALLSTPSFGKECIANYQGRSVTGISADGIRAPRLSEVKAGRVTQDAFGTLISSRLVPRRETVRPNPDNLLRNVASAVELVVKFNDDSLATIGNGRLSLPDAAAGSRLDAILSVFPDFAFKAAIKGGDDWLTALRFCAAVNTEHDHADLTAFFSAPITAVNRKRAVDLVARLLQHPFVETAWLSVPAVTPAADISPTTPDFSWQQPHLDGAPNGINIRSAWSIYPGAMGTDLRYVDLEKTWTLDHEDFPAVTDARSLFNGADPPGHGTAVVGTLSAVQNAFGVHGAVPAAQPYVADDLAGIAALRNSVLRNGDSIVIELTYGIDPKGACTGMPGITPAVPVERDDGVFSQISQLTANGVAVFEPAGNQALDLDALCWGGELSRTGRDSGAVLVAATDVINCGSGATNMLTAASFSNYGSRIDANGWGQCVTTTGYIGDLFFPNGDERQKYTQSFAGTSSATPIVMAAGMAIQGWQKARTGRVYNARTVRSILQNLGTPTTGPKFIAKQPDVVSALSWLAGDDDADGVANGDELSTGRLANISTRGQVGTGNDVMIAGFVIEGVSSKTIAFLGTGPSLGNFGIPNPLQDPKLTIVNQFGWVVAANDNWQSDPNAWQLQALGYAPSNPLESGILTTLPPGGYTAILEGVGGGTGVGLLSGYEVDPYHAEAGYFGNISTRGLVVDTNNPLIAGFQVFGVPRRVAIVALGPTLGYFGVPNYLLNPSITVVRMSDFAIVASNDDWVSPPSNLSALQATPFAPPFGTEAALVVTLDPGNYTVLVSPQAGTPGNGVSLISLYAY